jgi:flagellar biosynthesis protein FlhB
VDYLAKRIREVAEEHDVPVIENPPLARALYATVEVDHPIPQEHYKAVAEVIGYVMRLKGTLKPSEDLVPGDEPPLPPRTAQDRALDQVPEGFA